MKLRDIVNRDLVNLANCESEPIHIPGAIQPHGFLLALKGADFTIDFCSGNAAEYCSASHEQLLGKAFSHCFGEEEGRRLETYVKSRDFADANPVALQLGGIAYSCTIRRSEDCYIVEAEPFPDGFRNLPDLYRQTRAFVSLLERTQTLKELSQTIAAETRAITGYDRVMIYRFDADYNGEVIGEACREDLEPFLNLHYPHTDIPAQARELYLRNLLRMIVDVSYVPVPIYTTDDGTPKNLDLSLSVLRSVSPIHIEYLKNMGVGATLTISLIQDKKLWGLIACHHYSPKNIPHYTRLSAQLQGHFLTSQIAVRETSEAFGAGREVSAALEDLLPRISELREEDLATLIAQPELLHIARASGVALSFSGRLYLSGETPDRDAVQELGELLAVQYPDRTFSSNHLSAVYKGPASRSSSAAGILYHALSADGAHYIIWFRREQKTDVIWAGDPAKAMIKDEKGLSPRKSFAQWREQTNGQSKSWTEAEHNATISFAHALQKQLSLILIGAEEERYRLLSEQLQEANDELERINWISTHDLQEPLRKIQVFASRVLGSAEAGTASPNVIHAVERMSLAANRMQALVTDIHTYSKLLNTQEPPGIMPLDEIVAAVLTDLSEEIEDKRAHVDVTGLPVVAGEPFMLRQVFTNILRNALKFARAEAPLHISVGVADVEYTGDAEPDAKAGRYHRVSIADNGIGFENAYAAEIFGLFKRLHSQKEYGGTGIGLALCKKIMKRHNGFITAEGEPGRGATFYLWFPVIRKVAG